MEERFMAASQSTGAPAGRPQTYGQVPAVRANSQGISLFLCGDVMTGRGIDQIMPHPGSPVIHESYLRNANGYVQLAEKVNGLIPKPVSYDYIWGDALPVLTSVNPDLRVINLETSVTTNDDFWPKGINYRMHPRNAACLSAAGIDCCILANNHVLDWGQAGLIETLDVIKAEGIKPVGAGKHRYEATEPAVFRITGKGRLVIFAYGLKTSGIQGHEQYRSHLTLMYFPKVDPLSGKLLQMRMIPMQIKRFQTVYATKSDSQWLMDVLNREGGKLGTGVKLHKDGSLGLIWAYTILTPGHMS
jgi:poly-gamma-glutamate synthesis protein (capsule biosynthesis protein)